MSGRKSASGRSGRRAPAWSSSCSMSGSTTGRGPGRPSVSRPSPPWTSGSATWTTAGRRTSGSDGQCARVRVGARETRHSDGYLPHRGPSRRDPATMPVASGVEAGVRDVARAVGDVTAEERSTQLSAAVAEFLANERRLVAWNPSGRNILAMLKRRFSASVLKRAGLGAAGGNALPLEDAALAILARGRAEVRRRAALAPLASRRPCRSRSSRRDERHRRARAA